LAFIFSKPSRLGKPQILTIQSIVTAPKGDISMLEDAVFEEIAQKSEQFFRLSHHDKSHVKRVYNMAVYIAKEEGADLDVIKAAVLLHDVARALEDEGKIEDHALESAKMARKILVEVDFPKEKKPRSFIASKRIGSENV